MLCKIQLIIVSALLIRIEMANKQKHLLKGCFRLQTELLSGYRMPE